MEITDDLKYLKAVKEKRGWFIWGRTTGDQSGRLPFRCEYFLELREVVGAW